jgi:hypothetical protein
MQTASPLWLADAPLWLADVPPVPPPPFIALRSISPYQNEQSRRSWTGAVRLSGDSVGKSGQKKKAFWQTSEVSRVQAARPAPPAALAWDSCPMAVKGSGWLFEQEQALGFNSVY